MKYIIANWKMNMNLDQVEIWLDGFEKLIQGKNFANKIVLAPAATHLYKSSQFCGLNNLNCASQNVSLHQKGAHTGDVGAFEIKDFCKYSIVGHSERKEPQETVVSKRDLCLEQEITPIVCFVEKEDCAHFHKDGVLLAWEDPENISKGGVYKEKSPSEIIDTYKFFEEKLPNVPIIYGGSVNRENVGDLTKIKNLGGVLIGNASLDPQHFLDIISAFE